MKRMMIIAMFLLLAAVAPNIFPAAEAGYGTLHTFALNLLLPAIAILIVLALAVRNRQPDLWRAVVFGAAAGAVATLALEAVRLTGYRMGYMPGNLPRLMGVLLLNRFALGPNLASDIAGWAYHFTNGAAFGIIYALLVGTRRVWAGLIYGLAVGVGFLLSPVVTALGVGFLGLQFSIGFPITVLLAHAAFGLALGWLAHAWVGALPAPWLSTMKACLLPHTPEQTSITH